jgi:hypothetical protein
MVDAETKVIQHLEDAGLDAEDFKELRNQRRVAVKARENAASAARQDAAYEFGARNDERGALWLMDEFKRHEAAREKVNELVYGEGDQFYEDTWALTRGVRENALSWNEMRANAMILGISPETLQTVQGRDAFLQAVWDNYKEVQRLRFKGRFDDEMKLFDVLEQRILGGPPDDYAPAVTRPQPTPPGLGDPAQQLIPPERRPEPIMREPRPPADVGEPAGAPGSFEEAVREQAARPVEPEVPLPEVSQEEVRRGYEILQGQEEEFGPHLSRARRLKALIRRWGLQADDAE